MKATEERQCEAPRLARRHGLTLGTAGVAIGVLGLAGVAIGAGGRLVHRRFCSRGTAVS